VGERHVSPPPDDHPGCDRGLTEAIGGDIALSVAHVTRVTQGLRSERGNEDFPAPTHVHGSPDVELEPDRLAVDRLALDFDGA
jgi:hypothetical protein